MNYGGIMKKRLQFLAAIITLLIFSGSGNAIEVNTVLNNAEKGGKAVMLELGSVGCIPCEKMKPVMEKLRTNYRGKLEVLFVDVSKDSDTARRFRVFGIPTQVFLDKHGKEFYRHIGYFSYEEIVPVLKKTGL
jgi:thioredoxin 1